MQHQSNKELIQCTGYFWKPFTPWCVFSLLFITDLSSYNFFDEHIPLIPGSVDDEVDHSLLCATLQLPVKLQSHDLQILGHCPSEVCEVSGVGRSLKLGGHTKYEWGGGGGGALQCAM